METFDISHNEKKTHYLWLCILLSGLDNIFKASNHDTHKKKPLNGIRIQRFNTLICGVHKR